MRSGYETKYFNPGKRQPEIKGDLVDKTIRKSQSLTLNTKQYVVLKKNIFILFLSVCCIESAYAQHVHMNMKADSSKTVMQDSVPKHNDMMDISVMCNAYSLNLPMNRNGSGTSWQPDASPMYGYMIHSKKWMYMLHGNIFIRYNKQDLTNEGTRGGKMFDAPDMLMAMGQTKIGNNGLFHFNTMFSLEAPIVGGYGYPLLFQTGESWKGQPLVDRQHPHDLFSELSVSYSYSFSKKTDLFVYLGYPGEPALGPVSFMHRTSGMNNPDAPVGHHWTDATHITFGVATIGFRYGKFKVEGSSFTGREPDENRYNFDSPKFDSWSGRISFNPNKNWSMQASHGFLKSPEVLRPDENVNRTTASAAYVFVFGDEKYFSSTAIWGMNKGKNLNGSNDVELEASLRLTKFVSYFRYEWVQKSVEELNLDPSTYGNETLFPINATTIGAGYDLFRFGGMRIMMGGQFSWYHSPPALVSLYGKNPLAGEIYLRLYPGLM
ncbi:MAG TPA: hypothetical protein VMH01_10700 [Puia sp.]|nr:hypothetical protein [Puia sp.]